MILPAGTGTSLGQVAGRVATDFTGVAPVVVAEESAETSDDAEEVPIMPAAGSAPD